MNNQSFQQVEPIGADIWYSSYISQAISPKISTGTLNRYKNKINLITMNGTRVIEFIKQSQLVLPKGEGDKYYFVDSSKRYRPDLISLEMYGTPNLYWVILACNNLSHPLQVKTNMTLRIPALSAILDDGRLV